MADDQLLHFNGVNGATGDYGLPPMSGDQLADVIQGETDEAFLNELKWRYGQTQDDSHFGVKEGVDPGKLDEAGWAILFTHDANPAIREALTPLIELRRTQAGERFRIYEKGDGFRVGKDNKTQFLRRHGVGPGPVDPDKVPYYVMIVGSPATIPYRFQSQLDVQFAVGRIDFGEDLDAWANYADSVVAAETGGVRLARRMSFFGVANPDDAATNLSTEHLIAPLLEHIGAEKTGWETESFLRDEARKVNLARLLGGDATPSLLFTASHGMEFPIDDPRQIPHQGALLCQDWPGPKAWQGQGPIPQDHYFAGDDLGSDANLLGLIGFFFACYGCGTPRLDEFAKQAFKDRRAVIAPHDFLAGLPTRMLANPGGGALAVIGHVERAWGCSFVWKGAGAQTTVFESALDRLLDGQPVGSALEYFNERYAELSTVLTDELEEMEFGKQVDPYELAGMWTANNDARGYMILGDPAVRLPLVEEGDAARDRPTIELRSLAAVEVVSSGVASDGASQEADPAAATPPASAEHAVAAETARAPEPQPAEAKAPAPTAETAATIEPSRAPAPAAEAPVAFDDLDATAQSFGLFGGGASREPGAPATPGPFQEFMTKMGEFLVQAVEDVTTLEVDTWESSDLDQVKFEGGVYTGARLRASTRIMVDGDTKLCVPRGEDGTIDHELWAIHMESVKQAQEARREMIKTALDAGSSLLGTLKGG